MGNELDRWTVRSAPIQTFFDGHLLQSATGFFWNDNGAVSLVTNWHVLSGRHPQSRQPLLPDGAIPNELVYTAFLQEEDLVEKVELRVRLQDHEGVALWKQHPVYGPQVDIAALVLPSTDDISTIRGPKRPSIYAINQPSTPKRSIYRSDEDFGIDAGQYADLIREKYWANYDSPIRRKEMGDDVFVIGFPLDDKPTGHFPIWKRASIASEMDVPLNGLPAFLIDTATRPGMSGSPVIHRVSLFQPHGDGSAQRRIADELIGIYSGRYIGEQKVEAQLGIVWERHLIPQVVVLGSPGENMLR